MEGQVIKVFKKLQELGAAWTRKVSQALSDLSNSADNPPLSVDRKRAQLALKNAEATQEAKDAEVAECEAALELAHAAQCEAVTAIDNAAASVREVIKSEAATEDNQLASLVDKFFSALGTANKKLQMARFDVIVKGGSDGEGYVAVLSRNHVKRQNPSAGGGDDAVSTSSSGDTRQSASKLNRVVVSKSGMFNIDDPRLLSDSGIYDHVDFGDREVSRSDSANQAGLPKDMADDAAQAAIRKANQRKVRMVHAALSGRAVHTQGVSDAEDALQIMQSQKEIWEQAVTMVQCKEQFMVAFWLMWQLISQQRHMPVMVFPPLLSLTVNELQWGFSTLEDGQTQSIGSIYPLETDSTNRCMFYDPPSKLVSSDNMEHLYNTVSVDGSYECAVTEAYTQLTTMLNIIRKHSDDSKGEHAAELMKELLGKGFSTVNRLEDLC